MNVNIKTTFIFQVKQKLNCAHNRVSKKINNEQICRKAHGNHVKLHSFETSILVIFKTPPDQTNTRFELHEIAKSLQLAHI